MTNNTPNYPPIIITLSPQRAGALMAVTSAYASVLSFDQRLDYCIAELALWQLPHGAYIRQESNEAVLAAIAQTHTAIERLIIASIREGLRE